MKPSSRNLIRTVAATALGLASTIVLADPFYWTDWTGADLDPGPGFKAQGTITTPTSTVTVTYTNAQGIGFYQPSGGIDYYIERSGSSSITSTTSPYTSSLVDNRPTGTDIVALQYAGLQTLNFSQAIANPVFAFVSLNGNGYAFDQDFEILSLGGVDGNSCGYWGCGGAIKKVVDLGGGHFEYQLIANNDPANFPAGYLPGTEPHGTLRFIGTFDTVSWRSLTNEYWNGFTLGVQGTAVEVCGTNPSLPGCGGSVGNVPEPSVWAMLGLGLLGIGLAQRRRST